MRMNHFIKTFLFVFFITQSICAQTGIGVGIYPTGTEPGVGIRSGKNSKLIADVRICKANFFSNQTQTSFITEASAVYKAVRLEKVRFHIGIGGRTEWNFGGKRNKYGGLISVGVEAFPFPFQNAGLFFEVAPFFTHDMEHVYNAGIRTVSGFIFYFPKKEHGKISNQ